MDNAYAYDNMQNILSVGNRAAVAVDSPDFGGETEQSFSYDNLYQLTGASGTWTTRQGHEHRYALSMRYDTIGNIEAKDQRHERLPYEGDQWIKQKGTTYDWMYRYNGEHPHAATRIGSRTFTYDENGNQTGWKNLKNHTNRVIKWDEENRIASVSDNGQTSHYVYDADGERTLKRTSQGETFYVNPYYVIREGEVASKHFFAGSQRIATKLVKQEPHNNDNQGQKAILEKEQYYYHPDHLGSSSFITDEKGKVYEHLEYFPSGEEFGHEHSNTQVTPYRFTGKEYDEMTGLYYYGARYYDPRTSVWQSPDPILDQYMNGKINEGVFNPHNLELYTYSANNPINLKDPDGHASERAEPESPSQEVLNFRGNTYTRWIREKDPHNPALDRISDGSGNYSAREVESLSKTLQELNGKETALPEINNPRLKTFQTYIKEHPETGEIYIGRTSGTGTPEENIENRDRNHHKNNDGFGPAILDQSSSNYAAIRGREQYMIENSGGAKSQGGTSGNAINGVSDTNPQREYYLIENIKEFGGD